ncbi:MAG TPA: L-seryl-tRNA(Sec) selenium transferase, partial [Sinorhizobium sp.]|nr:L-seryl-tRNA(Sec) selenium transferase [Sinorhizobium sp.]
MDANARLRAIPSVDELLRSSGAVGAIERFGRPAVAEALRRVLATIRDEVRQGGDMPSPDAIATAAA